MLTESIKDMIPFLAVYFIGVLAFADAFESIDEITRIKQKVNDNVGRPIFEYNDDDGLYEFARFDTSGLNFY